MKCIDDALICTESIVPAIEHIIFLKKVKQACCKHLAISKLGTNKAVGRNVTLISPLFPKMDSNGTLPTP